MGILVNMCIVAKILRKMCVKFVNSIAKRVNFKELNFRELCLMFLDYTLTCETKQDKVMFRQ